MAYLIPIGEGFTYVLFSFLIGHVVLQFVKKDKKPDIRFPKIFLLLSVLLIVLFSFFPVLNIILNFYQIAGLSQTIQSVLADFQAGQSWLMTAAAAACLWIVIYLEGPKYIQGLLLLFMIAALGYASHAASLSFWPGIASHSIHFLSVCLWTGVLLHAAWFSKKAENWQAFLNWFTPFALICMTVLTASGLIVMTFVIDLNDYAAAWSLSYGQVILLKHISIVPLLVFAFLNGFVGKKAAHFQALAWVRAESIVVMIVFFLTGVLGTQAPPHDVNTTLRSDGASPLFELSTGYKVKAPIEIGFDFTWNGMLLFVFAALFIGMMVLSFVKKRNAYAACAFAVLFIVSAYLAFMANASVS
ncbi:copper resistance D family protein [Metabacillus idriensis]|uniref:copper resistance D family protein n=1 Tax=Metabacillus idriensis TaxID=324768 RepID=UPI003D2BFCA3